MQLFYNPTLNTSQTEVVFDAIESRHLHKVLRKQTGDAVHVTNGEGYLFNCQLTLATDKKCVANIINHDFKVSHKPKTTLAVAPTKSLDRLEWVLEKITEIGIDVFVPILCEHSERKLLKTDRLQKIAISAIKQSQQLWMPKIHELTPYASFVKQATGTKFIAHCEDDTEKNILTSQLNNAEHYTILIGPEGDFSPKEIALAKTNGFIPVSLGNNRLRTETAALVAICGIRMAL